MFLSANKMNVCTYYHWQKDSSKLELAANMVHKIMPTQSACPVTKVNLIFPLTQHHYEKILNPLTKLFLISMNQKKRMLITQHSLFLMPQTGIEPVREYKSRRILSPVRLPVPPLRHNQFSLVVGPTGLEPVTLCL